MSEIKAGSEQATELVGTAQIAKILGVTRMSVYNYRKRRVIPYYKIGGAIRFNPKEVLKSMAEKN